MSDPRIRPLALCLFRHEDRILVSRAYDGLKQDYYWRPLGGGIEFGEREAEAVVREIHEELGAEIENVRWLGTLENLFTCEGEAGHEIVLIFDAVFEFRSRNGKNRTLNLSRLSDYQSFSYFALPPQQPGASMQEVR